MYREHTRNSSSEWTDIDDSPPRRKSSSKRTVARSTKTPPTAQHSRRNKTGSASDLARFFPRLSRILEGNEAPTSSRPDTRASNSRNQSARDGVSRHRRQGDTGSIYDRPVKHRTGGVQRRFESAFKVNPSLLSVLSGLTTSTDQSSGSNSTITQRSYDLRSSASSIMSGQRRRHTKRIEIPSRDSRPKSPNVFDFMLAPSSVDEDHDRQSVMSSSSVSHYESSLAGSSDAPDTPSSHSTFPSPTSTRGGSVGELRRNYDPQYAASDASYTHGGISSPRISLRGTIAQPSVSVVAEDEEDNVLEPPALSELDYHPRQRSSSRSSRSSRSSQRSTGRLEAQEDAMRQHMAHAQAGHYVDPVYRQHRSSSASSATPSSPYQCHMAMQQYQWPTAPVFAQQAVVATHDNHPPTAPDPPHPDQRTLAGYEYLAQELASPTSTITPLYRKFTHLHHRCLLHLQDELSELEARLRILDEILASPPQTPEGEQPRPPPASRRAEAYQGSDLHHQRTALLGRIFLKIEQYRQATRAYAEMVSASSPAEEGQVEAYRAWMKVHSPIHDTEARFLERSDDLVVPGKPAAAETQPEKPAFRHAALACLPLALILPLLLFSMISTFGGRLAVMALIAAGAFLVAGMTRIRDLLPIREWAAGGAVYVLLMAAIAGWIPQRSGG